jgi:hypothetical protein
MYNPKQIHSQWAPLFPFSSRLVSVDLRDPKIGYPEILFDCRVCLLQVTAISFFFFNKVLSLAENIPSTIIFFSGNLFPLATLSNIEDQIFFLLPSLLDGRLPGPPESCVPVDIRDPIPTIS